MLTKERSPIVTVKFRFLVCKNVGPPCVLNQEDLRFSRIPRFLIVSFHSNLPPTLENINV